jgi:hypothetical protein
MVARWADTVNSFSPAGERTVYLAHGVEIRSELPLHGLREAEGSGAPDIDVRWQSSGPVPAEPPPGEPLLRLESQGGMRYAAAFDGQVHRLRFAGCCEFTVDAGLRAVGCHPDPSADPELVSILAAGALTSFVLTVAGITVLHASAVQVGDAAVGFVGASGFGKSTVAALMCAGGCELVADDVLRVELADQVLVHAGATELRLRSTVREIVDCLPGRVVTRHTADGRIAVRPRPTARTLLPLAALAIPRPVAPDDGVRVHRLSKVDALIRLLAFPRLLGWTSEDFLRQQFEGLADLVEHVPVFEVQVPSGPPFEAETGRRLRDALWADMHSEAAGSRILVPRSTRGTSGQETASFASSGHEG